MANIRYLLFVMLLAIPVAARAEQKQCGAEFVRCAHQINQGDWRSGP